MKKFMKSIQMMAALLLAVAATTACSNDDNAIDKTTSATTGAPKTYTLTVTASKGGEATTRALSIDGKGALNATWAKDEIVSVYRVTGEGPSEMEPENPVGTLTAQGSGTTTKLTGTFDGDKPPTVGAKFRLRFNAKPDYTTQKGTLEYIATHCDQAVADVTITDVNGEDVKTTAATFVNKQAIVKFSLKRPDGKTPLAAKSLTVKYGSSIYNVTLDSPASDIFVAIPGMSKKTVTLYATSADGDFGYEYSAFTFENGKYYTIGVKMTAWVTSNYTAKDGDVLTGKLGGPGASKTGNVKIAAGATVTLLDVDITNVADDNYNQMAGIECLGDATIILSGSNKVKSGSYFKPAIQVHSGHKLTIMGSGALEATARGNGAGIGGGNNDDCGYITITGGTVTATGGHGAGIGSGYSGSCTGITITGGTVKATGNHGAGIGSGYKGGSCGDISISGGTVSATGDKGAGIGSGTEASCGKITITGGNVTATGGKGAGSGGKGAGIGSGYGGSCGDITITDGVSSVTASKGDAAACSIGRGNKGSCGTVTIGGTVYYGGGFQNGGDTYLATSPLVYTPSAP